MDAFVRSSSSIARSNVCPENPTFSSFRRSLSKRFMVFTPQFAWLFGELGQGQQRLGSLHPSGCLAGGQRVQGGRGEHAGLHRPGHGLRSVAGDLS